MVRERTIYNSLNAWLFSLAKAHRGGGCAIAFYSAIGILAPTLQLL